MTIQKQLVQPWKAHTGRPQKQSSFGRYKSSVGRNGNGYLETALITADTPELVTEVISFLEKGQKLLLQMVNDRKQWQANEISTTEYELATKHNIDDAERLLQKVSN